MRKYSVVDLFAGAGGLSLGFMQTQKYDVKVAFENNKNMQDTYIKNHPGVDVQGDVCVADYNEIRKKYGEIDIVIGGPPCQGFSNANRQKNHAISMNNMLVKQYIRAVIELEPKAFVMENVSMLRSEVHRFYMEKGDEKLVDRYHIPVKTSDLVLLEKNNVFDGALDIIKNRNNVISCLWPEEHYTLLNIIYKSAKNSKKMINALNKHKSKLLKYAEEYIGIEDNSFVNKQSKQAFRSIIDYYSGKIDSIEIVGKIENAIMIQRMLSKTKEIYDNNILVDKYDCSEGIVAKIRSFAVFDYIKAILGEDEKGYIITSDVLCAANYGAPQKRMRFVVMGIKRSLSSKVALPRGRFDEDEYRTVRDAIADLAEVDTITDISADKGTPLEKIELSELAKGLRDSDVLYNHIITKTTDTAMERFRALKQGQNFHSLEESMKTNTYTDASRTQNTIYLRLNYDEPSGTVVNVRKSMWIHPEKDRAISIREAARLQTFPDSFVFCGTKDQQYQQVGNAVPPIMAKAIAKKLYKILSNVVE